MYTLTSVRFPTFKIHLSKLCPSPVIPFALAPTAICPRCNGKAKHIGASAQGIYRPPTQQKLGFPRPSSTSESYSYISPKSPLLSLIVVFTSHCFFSFCCHQCVMWPSLGLVASGTLRRSLLLAMICLSLIPVPASGAYPCQCACISLQFWCPWRWQPLLISQTAVAFFSRPLTPKTHQLSSLLPQTLPTCFI